MALYLYLYLYNILGPLVGKQVLPVYMLWYLYQYQ